jgi:aspartate aminotransferase/aminotransferase
MTTARDRENEEARLSGRARQVKESGIRRVFDLGATLHDPVNLSIGQPDFPVPVGVREAAKRAIDQGWNRYTPTQGIAPLREKVAEKLCEVNGLDTRADDVLVTSGSSGGIFLAFAALLDPGDEFIVPDPYFVAYIQLAAIFGARPALVDTYPSFQLDPERLEAAITPRTKAIVLNSPNNPTGVVYPEETLRAVAAIAERHGLIIISDEVYEPFVYDGARHFSIGSVYPDTITLNALSKSHSMTGWRLGYAAGPSAVVEKMKEIQQYTFVCAPSFAQVAAIEALAEGPAPEAQAYSRRRDIAYEGLCDRFEVVKPQGAFYIMPKVDDEDASAFVERAIERNVLIVPGAAFSTRRSHVRLSFATSEDQIARGVEILASLA